MELFHKRNVEYHLNKDELFLQVEGWSRVAIEDISHGVYDGPHATPSPTDEGPIFLGIKNITDDGHLDFSDIRHISEEEFPEWTKRVTPRPGDIVFTYEATLHRYAIIPDGFRGCLGRRVALLRPDTSKVCTRFLLYYFFSHDWRETVVQNMLHGSTVNRIPISDFPEFEVRLPSLPVQHRIADILSTYDDLIDNNARRIELLEEMAQAVYHEWFVELRFPGHAEAQMRKTEALGPVPAEWDVVPFTEIAEVLSGGTPKTTVEEYWDGPFPFFSPKDMPSSFYVTEDTSRHVTEEGIKNCSSELYPKETVFITARGTVGRIVMPAAGMAMNQSCYALQGKEGIDQLFVFFAIRSRVRHLKQRVHGAVFDTIIMSTFEDIYVAKPPQSLIERFVAVVRPLFDQMLNLIRRNATLRHTRDLQLPRLVSGEVAVGAAEEAQAGIEHTNVENVL